MNVELSPVATESLAPLPPPDAKRLRGAELCQILHWLASGRVSAQALTQTYLDAIAAQNAKLNAYVALNPRALDEARAGDVRRASGKIGRLDGVPVAVKDNFDVAGLPTGCGLPGAHAPATADAHAVARLRGAGAVILGKTQVPEAALAATSNNPHTGAAHNPFRHGYQAGGSSGGCAAAVAAGLAAVAIGSDSLGSIRIPASYCGLYALKPTSGEISVRGMVPAARRLDSVGLMARSVHDLGVLLHVLGGHDPGDPRSRRRRVELALPDWEPGKLRVGLLGDLGAFGIEPGVKYAFERALSRATADLRRPRRVAPANPNPVIMRAQAVGSGTALMEAVAAAARDAGCRRVWLITTNDNLRALRFYQRRGFRLAALHRDALDRSRELKPSIPDVGLDGIPLRDELELELTL